MGGAHKQRRFELEGSELESLEGRAAIGRPPADERIAVTLILRAGRALPTLAEARAHAAAGLNIEEYQQLYGSSREDAQRVADFATDHGLKVAAAHPERWLMTLAGPVSQMEAAFGVTLAHFEGPVRRAFRGRLSLPVALRGVVRAAFGLEDLAPKPSAPIEAVAARGKASTSEPKEPAFKAPEVAQLYDFPTNRGNGQCIGLIEMHGPSGGYNPSDLQTYFTSKAYLGWQSMPDVVPVPVGTGSNQPPTGTGLECTERAVQQLRHGAGRLLRQAGDRAGRRARDVGVARRHNLQSERRPGRLPEAERDQVPGHQLVGAVVRRHLPEPTGRPACRDGVGRQRRWRQRDLPSSGLAIRCWRPAGVERLLLRPWRAGRRRQRLTRLRISRLPERRGIPGRRHQRRGAAVGRPGGAVERGTTAQCRIPQSRPVRLHERQRVQPGHFGQQRLPRANGLGPLYRAGDAQRH